MGQLSVLGIDLAKSVFQIHGNDDRGKTLLRKQLKRGKLIEFIAQLPACLIGMESCSGAHHWAREFEKLGHSVRLIAPQFVKPFVKSNKNDACDAEAIAEAVVRPNMRFVPIKQPWQQDIQVLHRARQRLVRGRTALINELHGFMAEYGIALKRGETRLLQDLAEHLSPESEILSAGAKESIQYLVDELRKFSEKVEFFDKKISQIARQHDVCKRLQSIPGVGVITATAVLAAVSNPKLFKNGRQFSAWLGLVPRQSSSGGKNTLLGISKRGDTYIRCLLVHGARSSLCNSKVNPEEDRLRAWACEKEKTRGRNRAIVALANKNARIIWALMISGEAYKIIKKAA